MLRYLPYDEENYMRVAKPGSPADQLALRLVALLCQRL